MKIYETMFVFILCLGFVNTSWSNECSREDAIKADEMMDSLNTWESVYQAFLLYGKCDDASIGEGYSDRISILLATDWKDFNRLKIIAHENKKFKSFVIKHIDDTVPIDILEKIIFNTKNECPQDAKKLCKEIYKAASNP